MLYYIYINYNRHLLVVELLTFAKKIYSCSTVIPFRIPSERNDRQFSQSLTLQEP